ncbi:MAG: FMN-binding protein, partial [Christensenellales bacterium]
YTGTGTGMLDKIEVAVTFDADTITGIEVVSCNDTPGVCDAAVEKIPAEIVKYQSLGVDVATSATFTSSGILEAVADAVNQAGGDVDALKAVPVEGCGRRSQTLRRRCGCRRRRRGPCRGADGC